MNLSPVNYQPMTFTNNNQKVSFKSLKNVYVKGFDNPQEAEKIVEWFKNNKYVKQFLEKNDVDLHLESKKKGKSISLNMNILKYIQELCTGPYREMTSKPFNVRSLTSREVVTKMPKEKAFGLQYSVKSKTSEDAMEQMKKYLDENTDNVYREYDAGKHWGEILVKKEPHISQDISETKNAMDNYLYGSTSIIKN